MDGKIKRSILKTPLSYYKASHWCDFSASCYFDIYKKKYEKYPLLYPSHCKVIKSYIYPVVFREKKWSSRDFAKFIIFDINRAKQSGIDYAINLMKSVKGQENIIEFDKILCNERNSDRFEDAIYLPHEPLLDDPGDLMDVLGLIQSPLLIMYNFGIPIFHKYMQIKNNISFLEAKKITSDTIRFDVIENFKDDRDILRRILEGIVKNSCFWGPYYSPKKIKKFIAEEDFIIDWRKEYDKVWKIFKFEESDFWEYKNNEFLRPILKPVKFLFDIEIRELKCIKKTI